MRLTPRWSSSDIYDDYDALYLDLKRKKTHFRFVCTYYSRKRPHEKHAHICSAKPEKKTNTIAICVGGRSTYKLKCCCVAMRLWLWWRSGKNISSEWAHSLIFLMSVYCYYMPIDYMRSQIVLSSWSMLEYITINYYIIDSSGLLVESRRDMPTFHSTLLSRMLDARWCERIIHFFGLVQPSSDSVLLCRRCEYDDFDLPLSYWFELRSSFAWNWLDFIYICFPFHGWRNSPAFSSAHR